MEREGLHLMLPRPEEKHMNSPKPNFDGSCMFHGNGVCLVEGVPDLTLEILAAYPYRERVPNDDSLPMRWLWLLPDEVDFGTMFNGITHLATRDICAGGSVGLFAENPEVLAKMVGRLHRDLLGHRVQLGFPDAAPAGVA
jgi:hypothetical protein